MALQFGVGTLTVSGIALARLQNINLTVSYDIAQLRGDNRIFADKAALYNGNMEGTFEQAEINITAYAAMMGATGADIAFANGSGTLKITANSVLITGADIIVSCVTDGVTGTLTIKNCLFNSLGLTIDRENYTIPTTNFVAKGDANGLFMSWQI